MSEINEHDSPNSLIGKAEIIKNRCCMAETISIHKPGMTEERDEEIIHILPERMICFEFILKSKIRWHKHHDTEGLVSKMTDIVRYESDPLSEQLKAKWASRLKPVDNFTITEWPGKLEDTSLICDIAVQDQDLFAEHSSDAIIPYVNQETADYYEVFDFTQEETPKASAEKTADYADRLDKSIALASGLLTGLIDVLFVGEFSIERAKQYGEKDVEDIVKKTAKKFGYKGNDIKGAIEHLEKKFPIAADSKIDDYGGAKQHHLWDFTHHFSILGLLCSVLTQFTGKVIGTNKEGMLLINDVSECTCQEK